MLDILDVLDILDILYVLDIYILCVYMYIYILRFCYQLLANCSVHDFLYELMPLLITKAD